MSQNVPTASAAPSIELSKLFMSWSTATTYWLETSLSSGQSLSTGSPLTAADNPVVAEIVRRTPDGSESVVGTVALDPGGSVDFSFVEGVNGADDRVLIVGLAGSAVVTIGGQTRQVTAGSTWSPVVWDTTAPTLDSVVASVPVLWPPNGRMTAERIAVSVFD